ncbi:hypothetical protein ACHAXT_006657 [Thalassiosira profunda]
MKAVPALAAAALAGVASANPFAAKTSANTREASHVGGLLSKARPTANSRLPRRRLEQQELDLSAYSIKFEKCQFIQQFAEEMNEDIDSILETKRFVIFRLCPNNSCASCDEGYGEYLIDMETYLESTLQQKEEEQEQYCQACEECGNDDAAADNGRRLVDVDCNTCYTQCQNIENMEENGYVDAAEYVDCQKVYENQNTGLVYYAGAICTNGGSRIKVGLFTDQQCTQLDSNADMAKYLKNNDGYNVKMSYHLLKQTFPADQCVASCAQADENAADDDANAAQAETAEVCQELYEAAGKCESPHGFADGMDYSNSDYYDVQLANEEAVCAFVDTIYAGNYKETGEVVVTGGRTTFSGGMKTTGGQKFALTFFAIGTAGLAMYAVVLYQRIKSARRAFSGNGGSMV